jgi:2-polyprenyl-3-methyl-5-hydroxy-6-metoxy-1,4-benzoquinol methylase
VKIQPREYLCTVREYLVARNPVIQTIIKSGLYPILEYKDIFGDCKLILDVGCGEGILANRLSKVLTAEIIGLDCDKVKIEIAKTANLALSNLRFINTPFEDLDNDKYYDLVIFNDFLHHKSTKEQFTHLVSARNRLNKDGRVLIRDIAKLSGIDHYLTRKIDRAIYPNDNYQFNNRTQWENLFKSVGLKPIVEFSQRMIWPSNQWNCILEACHD